MNKSTVTTKNRLACVLADAVLLIYRTRRGDTEKLHRAHLEIADDIFIWLQAFVGTLWRLPSE